MHSIPQYGLNRKGCLAATGLIGVFFIGRAGAKGKIASNLIVEGAMEAISREKQVRWGRPALAAVAAAALLFGSPVALEAARRAIAAWLQSFLPAMLPFFLLTPFLTGPDARALFERVFDRPLRLFFRVPGRAAGAILAGFLAGSPAGSVACAEAGGEMTPGEYERCAYLVSGLSPAFLMASVGVGCMGSQSVGWILIGSHYSALLFSGLLLRRVEPKERASGRGQENAKPRDAILTAFAQCARVCGWMIVFGALSALAAVGLRGLVPGWTIAVVCEIAGGAAEIAALPVALEARAVLLAFASGFGGLCVGAQCVSVTGVKPLRMLRAKALHAVLSALFCAGFLRLPKEWVMPTFPDAFALSGFAAAFAALLVCACALRQERSIAKQNRPPRF